MKDYKNALKGLEWKRKKYVEAKMLRFDKEIRMAAENNQ